MVVLGQVKAIIIISCVVVLGSTFLKLAVLRVATLIMRASTSTTSVFVLCVVLRGLSSPLYSCPFALYPSFLYPYERSDLLKIFLSESGFTGFEDLHDFLVICQFRFCILK
jgi:hypothetical protein